MKRFFFLLLFYLFLIPQPTYAAETGLPPFIVLNNKLISKDIERLTVFLPESLDPTTQEAQTSLTFRIEKAGLAEVIPDDNLVRAQYTWHFGDGTQADGEEATHTYNSAGSYFVLVNVRVPVDVIETPTIYTQTFFLTITSPETQSLSFSF